MDRKVDWYGKPYYSLDAYFKNTYGQKCYKIAVDAGFTCPNRDGKLDNRGCIFCSAGGSGDFAVRSIDKSINEQINEGISRFNKSVGDKFVIYFQAYTNTYGDIDYLERIYREALDNSTVIGISIATRPDCLNEEVLDLLKALHEEYSEKNKFIWVELGLQTIHEKTAEYIRRHYKIQEYGKAVLNLESIGIPYITHVILGLPGETREMMLDTVRYVCKTGNVSGIKLQLLHVLKHTDLSYDYANGLFSTMEMDEYIDLVIDCVKIIPDNVVIHRITGDGPKSLLISPEWSTNKKNVLNTLHKRFKELGAFQGESAE